MEKLELLKKLVENNQLAEFKKIINDDLNSKHSKDDYTILYHICQYIYKEKLYTSKIEKILLDLSIFRYDLNSLKYLVENGAIINNINYLQKIIKQMAMIRLSFDIHFTHEEKAEEPFTIKIIKLFKYLVENFSDINICSDHGNILTYLIYAYFHVECETTVELDVSIIEIAKYLVKRGVNINVPNDRGNTPLFYACCSEYIGIIKYLLDNGADKYIQNKKGETPIDVVREMKHKKIAEKIEKLMFPADRSKVKAASD